jgi:hypothetical protein
VSPAGKQVLQVAPRLLWHVDADGWNVLSFEHVAGRHADYSPGSPDLPKVIDAMRIDDPLPPEGVAGMPAGWWSGDIADVHVHLGALSIFQIAILAGT